MGESKISPNKALDAICKSDIIKKEDWFLLLPVKEGLIKYTDLKDGTINFRDIVYLNEMIDINHRVEDYYRQLASVEAETNKMRNKYGR